MRLSDFLSLPRCPYCAIANPLLTRKWATQQLVPRGDGQPPSMWAVFACTTCGSLVCARGAPGRQEVNAEIDLIMPEPKVAHEDIPDRARRFLQQAYETLHAPDAAAMLAGSAVDAMLKQLGLEIGSLYARIDDAVQQGKLTEAMGQWAHAVRLGSNRPRHADAENPHVSPSEAEQSVAFAEALGQFLFVLTARIQRGIESAEAAAPAHGG